MCKCFKSSHLREVFLFSMCPHLVFPLSWFCYEHVRYIYPTMHLSPSLESLCNYVFLCSILLSPLWVRRYSACNVHIIVFFLLRLHVLCSFFALSIPHTVFFVYFPPSGQKLLRLFSSKVYCLCLTACVWCILALRAPLPLLPPTQYLSASLSGLKWTHFFPPPLASLHSSLELFNKCHE